MAFKALAMRCPVVGVCLADRQRGNADLIASWGVPIVDSASGAAAVVLHRVLSRVFLLVLPFVKMPGPQGATDCTFDNRPSKGARRVVARAVGRELLDHTTAFGLEQLPPALRHERLELLLGLDPLLQVRLPGAVIHNPEGEAAQEEQDACARDGGPWRVQRRGGRGGIARPTDAPLEPSIIARLLLERTANALDWRWGSEDNCSV